nr:hypothetical protein [Streptomonospora nanhaiensis]
MQLRITTARVVVVERGCEDAGDIDVRDRTVRPGGADAGGRNLAFEERNHLCNRLIMRIRDQRLRAPVRNTPPRRQRLRHRERQIVAGDRAAGATLGLLRLDRRDLLRTRHRPQLRGEVSDPLIDALLHARVLPIRLTQRLTRDRVAAHPDQKLKLRLGHLPALGELTTAEVRQDRPHPKPGRCSLLRVVPLQRRGEVTVAVTGGDGAQQVLVAVAGRHYSHRDRHTGQVSRRRLATAKRQNLPLSTWVDVGGLA